MTYNVFDGTLNPTLLLSLTANHFAVFLLLLSSCVIYSYAVYDNNYCDIYCGHLYDIYCTGWAKKRTIFGDL